MYIRVSTDEQAGDERMSLPTQKRICSQGMEQNGFVLAENGVYADPGKTGTNMNRPGLQDMLIRIQEDKTISAVFVQDIDRLARNVADHLTIRALLRKHNIEFFSVSQPGINDNPEGKMMDLIVAGFSQFQSDITSRKTIKSLEEKFRSGWWPTKAPIGYLNASDARDEKKRIVVLDKLRAPLVAEMFKLYATGDYSIAEVRDIAHRKGLVTLVGKRLAKSKMFSLIRCPFYYGEMHWQGLVQKGNHAPIITKDTFDRCQRVIEFNNKHACRRRKHDFLLRGFVFCATCEQRHTAAHHPKKNKSYYYCSRGGDRKPCSEKYVEVDYLEKQVQGRFDEIQFSPELVQKIVARVQKLYKNQKDTVASEKRKIVAQKVGLEKKLEIAEEKLVAGVLSDNAYTRVKDRANEQLSSVEDMLYKLDRNKNLKMDIIQEVLRVVRHIGRTYRKAPPQLKRLYLGLFWEEFRVANKKVVEARKTPVIAALEAAGSITFNKAAQNLLPPPNAPVGPAVQIGSVLGA